MDSRSSGPLVHRIFQARILKWVDISFSISLLEKIPSPGNLPNLGIELQSLAWQAILYHWVTREALCNKSLHQTHIAVIFFIFPSPCFTHLFHSFSLLPILFLVNLRAIFLVMVGWNFECIPVDYVNLGDALYSTSRALGTGLMAERPVWWCLLTGKNGSPTCWHFWSDSVFKPEREAPGQKIPFLLLKQNKRVKKDVYILLFSSFLNFHMIYFYPLFWRIDIIGGFEF